MEQQSRSTNGIHKLPDDVIRKIKAGEVIVRPFNAVKELIENSLDAKSSHIIVKVKGGGKDVIQVIDNGIGISKDDLMVAFQKYTTSKLTTFDDLSKLTTYGFRGEALSSISDASHLTITSKTKDSVCGYKVAVTEGIPETDEPKPIAANLGTTVKIDQLFFNMPIRKKSLKSASEEYHAIVDLVSKYAIHCSNFVSFVLEKEESRSCDVQTLIESQTLDNIRLLYGKDIAANLSPLVVSSDRDIFTATGFISHVNFTLKKMIFILFINDRLVDCAPLKKSMELTYSNFLAKGSHPFVYLSIKMDPANLDVNVHPSKNEVRFLYEEHIISEIKSSIETKLASGTTSRVINTSMSGPSLSGNKSTSKLNTSLTTSLNTSRIMSSQKVNPSQKVRTDSKNQTINQVWNRNELSMSSGENKIFRIIELQSVMELRKEVINNCDLELRTLLKDSCYIGCVSPTIIAIQHETRMLLLDLEKLSLELFYQIYLQDFGNFALLDFAKPHSIKKLYELFVRFNPNVKPGDPDEVCVKLTLRHITEMVNDYFSMTIEPDATLSSLPVLLNGYHPNPHKLPIFIYDLAHNVNWNEEKACFRTFGRALAKFYSAYCSEDSFDDWEKVVSSILYPKIKTFLKPSEDLKECFKVSTSTNDLYKVFERC